MYRKTQDERVQNLFNKDAKSAYSTLKELLVISSNCKELYPFMDTFITMLDHDNSYVRMRGIQLIGANAKWDNEQKIKQNIAKILEHMEDEKPIVSRYCVKETFQIASYQPELIDEILNALERVDKVYQSSMQSLLYQDRKKAIRMIRQLSW